jgi:tetratricopeptide (TPR) repeat protein
MHNINFEVERKALDRLITFFQFKKAQHKVRKCIKQAKQKGDSFFTNFFLAQQYILKEDFMSALNFLNIALANKEFDGCAHNDKALCLAELGRLEEAYTCFQEGIRKDRDCVSLYHNKGWLLNTLGRYKESVLCFKKALELQDNRPESLYSLADTYVHLGETQKAKQYFRKALHYIKGKSAYMHKETLKRIKELDQ